MKTRQNRKYGLVAFVVLTALAFIACGGGSTTGGDPSLSGTITISPAGPVSVNTLLTAFYSGSEYVSYQWKRSTTVVGTDSPYYTPGEAGSYTVTVSAEGYASKTSAAVTVTVPSGPTGNTLEEKLQWLKTNAQSNNNYILDVDADETLTSSHLLYYLDYDNVTPKTSITITLKGVGANRTISPSSNSIMFTVFSGVTLILDNNITLHGGGTIYSVSVGGGTLIMNNGSTITGASYGVSVTNNGTFTMNGGEISNITGCGVDVSGTFTMYDGIISNNTGRGGVYMSGSYNSDTGKYEGGTFTLHGGVISNNTASDDGGGVTVGVGGTFTMHGGSISNNTASNDGGGVTVGVGATFTMHGGTISDNTASSDGGGVSVGRGTFTMNGGEISNNTTLNAYGDGGGVYVGATGTFTMNDGEILNNTNVVAGGGGGVGVRGTFTMYGGEISNNTTLNSGGEGGGSEGGGGVFVGGGTFTMEGGVISNNTASYHLGGGGVYVVGGTFNKTGGTITGYADDTVNGNVVKNSSGTVLSNMGHTVSCFSTSTTKRKETTAGPEMNLSYDGTTNPVTFSGAWDY